MFGHFAINAAISALLAKSAEQRGRRARGFPPVPVRPQVTPQTATQWTSQPASGFDVSDAILWGSVIGSLDSSPAVTPEASPACDWSGDGGLSGGAGASGEW